MAKTEQKSAPAGTGHLPGLGEAFTINLSTGQGTYAYQIPLPDGVGQHSPRFVLEYVHGAGHGAWGLGWRMPSRTISRRLDFGAPDTGLVERFLDSGNEIIPIGDGTFRAMRETVFARYTRAGDGWRVEERNGLVHELGLNPAARIAPPDHPERPVEWLLERTLDTSGSAITYSYRLDEGFGYPSAIRYAAYEVRFSYENRPDARRDGRAGFSRRRALRCTRLQLVLDPGPSERVVRTYHFVYEAAPVSAVTLLSAIRLTANGAATDGSEDVQRPTARFTYSSFEPGLIRLSWMTGEAGLPPGLEDDDTALVTLDNAPLPGILINRNGAEFYWANRGEGRWAPPRPLRSAPLASSFQRDGLAFLDMDGSGTADLMVANTDSLQGYYENAGRDGWGSFVAFPRNRRAAPPWSDPNLRITDANSDGLVDAIVSQRRAFALWRNEGRQGWATPTLVPKVGGELPEIDFSDPDVHLADMTGDGSPDIVRIQSGRVEYWPSLGAGRFGAKVTVQNSPRLRRDFSRDTLLLADLDGDGCAELVHVSAHGLRIYPNQNGTSFGNAIIIDTIPAPLPGTVRAVNLSGHAAAGLMWNSLTRTGPGYVQFEFASTQAPYLLSRIENGSGLVSEIVYRSAIEDYERDRNEGALWRTNFPFPYQVVGRTRETDSVSGRETIVDFRYHEAHFARHSRQFQGFRRTDRIERGDASRPDSQFVHHFLMAQERVPGNGPEHAELNGLLSRVETFQLDGSPEQGLPFRVETSTHGLTVLNTTPDGRTRSFVFLTMHRAEDIERTGDSRVETKSYTYDAVGNVLREVQRGSGTEAGVAHAPRERSMETTYAASATHYLLDKPARVVVRDARGVLCSERRFFYDGADFIGLPFGEIDRGLLNREEEWTLTQVDFDNHYAGLNQGELGFSSGVNADGAASVFATPRRHRHDARGLLLATRDPLGNETRFVYDADGLFRTSLIDPLGQTRFTYDRATGQIAQIEYADGAITRFAYDAQGRVLRAALPGENLADAATVYAYDESQIPNRRTAHFRQADGATSVAITYFDGSGKEFQSRTESEPGTFLVSALKLPSPWGLPRAEFEPRFAASGEFALPDVAGRPVREFFYDACGRVTRTVNFNGGVSTAEYQPFRVILRDANDNDTSAANQARGQFNTPREEEFDVFRYLVRVTDHISPTTEVTTSYEIGPLGELIAVIDGRGAKFRYRYDRCGNRISILLREAGERKIWYDARRKPVRTLDPAGHDLRAEWDTVGRQTRLTTGPTVLEEYVYDTPAQHAHGRLAEAHYIGGSQSFTYDAAGRLLARDYFHDGEADPRRIQYEYDPIGRETAIEHSDGTRIEREYTLNGWIKAIPNVIDSLIYDARGLPTEVQFHNGVRTKYTHTPGPGRISRQTVTSPLNEVFEDTGFSYDRMDILLGRNDSVPGGTGPRDFAYDPLYQLLRESNVENGNVVHRSYDYAADYNLHRSDEGSVTLRYEDAAHPDRLSGLTPDGGAAFAVGYDGNGNLLNLPGQQFEYNAKNELVRFRRNGGLVADYRYDHLGVRASQVVDDGHGNIARTLLLGDAAEIRDGVPAYFVTVGPLRVAVISGGAVRYLHDDGLGSTGFVTDATGQRIGRLDGRPFGNVTSSSGDTDFRTYSLHPVDAESGLVYMRRRYYSPLLGRFLTPDLMAIFQPEKFLHAPQGLHLYAFVANDPLNKSDVTGLSFWSFLGSVVGVVVGIVVGLAIVAAVVATGGLAGIALGIGLAFAAGLAVTGVSYLIANNVDPNSGFGQFMRGFMIGFNAGMNGVLAAAIFGPVVGVALGVINFLATFEGVATSPVYQGILGWSSWFMPMSWGATALGVLFFVINIIAAGVTFQQWDAAKIEKLHIDWKTGSIVMVNGLIRGGTAFNNGNFVFMNQKWIDNPASGGFDAVLGHETGHGLNNAAFGTAFNLYDTINASIFNAGFNDYGEQLAESHTNRPGRPTIPMWG